MNTFPSNHDLDGLGGRLPLLAPADLDDQQRPVYEALERQVVPEAAHSGFTARLDDGRFVGPFNAMLRTPKITAGFGQWTGAIARSGMSDEVRQVVILTVGATWSAAYELDAHVAGARSVGVPEAAIAALLARTPPEGLSSQADVAHRITAALLDDHAVPEELYREAVEAFGEHGLLAVLHLIGQYQTISAVLVCFEVPVPQRRPEPLST